MDFIYFILILVALILIHEFGHFVAAKFLGVSVQEFAIGFPPRLWSIVKGGTQYSFNLLLFGGYVRLLGENEIEDQKAGVLSETRKDPRSFSFKSGWTQAAITLAGVGMNFLSAWIAFIIVFLAGAQVDASSAAYPAYLSSPQVVIESVSPNSPAAISGLTQGDVILKAASNSDSISNNFSSADFQQLTSRHANNDMMLTVMHGTSMETVVVRPKEGIVPDRAAIGVELADVAVERLPLPLAVIQGSQSFWAATMTTAVGLGSFAADLIRGHGDFSQVSGPVGIAQIGAESVSEGFSMGMLFAAVISINLAILNLLPIPGLDGGRLLFIVIERIKGSAIHPKMATRITIAGFAFLITLMVLVTYHDIARLI